MAMRRNAMHKEEWQRSPAQLSQKENHHFIPLWLVTCLLNHLLQEAAQTKG